MATTWADSVEDRYNMNEDDDETTLKERFAQSRTALKFVRLALTTIVALASVYTLTKGVF